MTPSNFKRFAASALVPMLGAFGFTLATSATAAAATSLPKTINVGVQLDLEGAAAGQLSHEILKAMQLAVKQINSTHYLGSSEIKITLADTRGENQLYPTAYQTLINDHVSAIVGGVLSPGLLSVASLVNNAHIPVVVSTAGDYPGGKWWFKASPDFTASSKSAMTALLSGIHSKDVASLYESDIPSNLLTETGMKESVNAAGSKLTEVGFTASQLTNLSAQIAQVKSANPDLVSVSTDGDELVTMFDQVRQQGYTGLMYTPSDLTALVSSCGSACNAAYFYTTFNPAVNAASKTFSNEFDAAYGALPDGYAAQGYDAMWFAAEGVKKSGSAEPAKIDAALNSTKTFDHAHGEVAITDHIMQYTPIVEKVSNGQVVATKFKG